jgi:hypothetical protein
MHKTILAAALAVIGRCRRQRWGGGSDAYLRRSSPTSRFRRGRVRGGDGACGGFTAIAILRLKDKQVVGSFWPPSRNHAQHSTGSTTIR